MTLNTIHHIAIICSDKEAALHFYHKVLGFPIIRSNFRQGRQDWKIDLRINETTELELFTAPSCIPSLLCGRHSSGAGECRNPL